MSTHAIISILSAPPIHPVPTTEKICSALICRSCSSTPAARRSPAFPSATATGAEATTPSPLRRTAVRCCARPSRWWITPRATITPPTRRPCKAPSTFACAATPRAISTSTAILSRPLPTTARPRATSPCWGWMPSTSGRCMGRTSIRRSSAIICGTILRARSWTTRRMCASARYCSTECIRGFML